MAASVAASQATLDPGQIRCGTLRDGEDPAPLRHQVIEIPPITPLVIEHRLHRLVCPCCSTSTCAPLPADVEASPYGPRLSALAGLLGSAFPLSFSKTQALLNQLLGVEISRGAIAIIRKRLSAALAQPMAEALEVARAHPVACVDETGTPTGNAVDAVFREAVGNNPAKKRGWQWVMVTAVVTVFIQGLSRSTAAAMELLGTAFGGIVVSDRISAYNHLPLEQRQICWAHVIRELTAIAERPGASAEYGGEPSIGPTCNRPAGRSARPLRPRCKGWWSWAIQAASDRRGPKRSARAGRSSKWPMPFGPFWRSVESSPPTTPQNVPCASR
ncbi:MAG: transposase [Cyanobacteriota bacterium]